MMKSYLRFSPSNSFGAICSPSSNAIFDFSGNLLITAAVEDVCVWNTRQANKVATLKPELTNYPFVLPGEVSFIERSSDKCTIAVGYSTGQIRIFNYITNTLVGSFKGHRSGISSLCYDTESSSTVLASGGKDSDIFLWDMVSLNGLCKLRGHKDAVTSVKFFSKSSQRLLVSASKDTLLKVWDITTEHCLQTIVGHRSEVWCMAVRDISSESFLLLTGSSDDQIRGYNIAPPTSIPDTDVEMDVPVTEGETILHFIGAISRQNGNDKCTGLSFSPAGDVVVVQGSGKTIEVYGVRDDSRAKKKMKRRLKRLREKASSGGGRGAADVAAGASLSVWGEEDEVAEEAPAGAETVLLSDVLQRQESIKCGQRVRSTAFSPTLGRDAACTLLVALVNNSMELYKLPRRLGDTEAAPTPASKTSVVEMQGHRSDVRAVAVGSDGNRVATCSAEGVKVWNVETGTCLSSCLSGYGVSVAFAPGGRYVLVGSKEGALQVVDSASGEVIVNEADAHSGAIWSICIRPDSKGFSTSSADALVKFWDFTISNGTLGIKLMRELQMTHDALCVRYSNSKAQEKLLVAVGLLDNTVKVFFEDSMKFFLSLYGHKLPVMCIDISYDNTILISGSADKTVKIWGLDFGDCHRSLFAHTDSVTAVRFQPQSHYFFSSGKEGLLKYWDADRFEQILMLPGHVSSIWGLDLSFDGTCCVSVGADRTLRVWRRSDDLVFVEEEKEKALEAQIDEEAERMAGIPVIFSNGIEPTSLASVDSAKGGDKLINAIDLVEQELIEHDQSMERGKASKGANPNLLGKSPLKFMIFTLRQIASHDLEQALIMLPFHYARRLVAILLKLCKSGLDIELCSRSLIFILRCHESAILSARSMLSDIIALQQIVRSSLKGARNLIGTNLSGLKFMSRVEQESKTFRVEKERKRPQNLSGPSSSSTMKKAKKKKKKKTIL